MPKEVVTQQEFIDLLLVVWNKIKQTSLEYFDEHFDYTGENKKLILETSIFSLWVVTLAIASASNSTKNLFHDNFCDSYGFDAKEKQNFYKLIDKRYSNYYDAFQIWQKNHGSGHMVGSVIVETIINQNPDFPFDKEIPQLDFMEVSQAFILFGEQFKFAIKAIGKTVRKF